MAGGEARLVIRCVIGVVNPLIVSTDFDARCAANVMEEVV